MNVQISLLQAKQQLQFSLPTGRPSLAFFWDHQVQGAAILPGAAYFELATAAAHTLLKLAAPPVAVVAASIAAPFKLPAAAEGSSVVLTAEVALVAGDVSIRSGPADKFAAQGASMLHLKGSVASVSKEADAVNSSAAVPHAVALSVDAVRAACCEPQPTAGLYGKLAAAGLNYGPEFR